MEQFYQEPAKKIPVKAKVEVLVVGGGPAGFAAAVSAARAGVDTLLVETAGDIGGVSTTGLMSHWTGNTRGGFYDELLSRSMENPSMRQTINPEKLKGTMLEMLQEANVRLLLYTFASDVIMDGNRLQGIIVESKSGREAIYADVIIDATGDGDIAEKAGVPYTKGRDSDGKMQPMTLMFKVAGVDYDRAIFPSCFEDNIQTAEGGIQDLAHQHLPFPAGHVLLYRSTLPGIVTCNMTNCIDVDGTSAEDLTRAALTCRSQIPAIVSFLREHVPGYENCFVISSASHIGVRETRHFEGLYTLTEQDISEARLFDDWVVTRAHFNFDVHNVTGSGLDKAGVQRGFSQRSGYSIPYRCLIPQNIDGLLLSGRNISGTHMAHSNFRAMPICANIGQACGVAAALSAKQNVQPRHLSIEALQATLKEHGVQP